MRIELDAVDQRLLNLVQRSFPLCPRPWAELGLACGLAEHEVLARIHRLKAGRLLRQIGAIFDSKALGYRSALVAAQAEPSLMQRSADIISAHAGVSHNYERDHAWNLWFTMAVPARRDLQAEVDRLGGEARLRRWQVLPALQTFRIGVAFDLESGKATAMPASAPKRKVPAFFPGPQDEAAIRALQADLVLIPEPFEPMAQALGWPLERLFEWMADAHQHGWLRRYAAVLRHREAGFGEGAMGVWAVPPSRVEELGQAFAGASAVTHCYQRPTFEGWPFNIFTMVHGTERGACLEALDALAENVPGWVERSVLFSTKEFKKERVRYFLEEAHAIH